jgi:hypothetical protein
LTVEEDVEFLVVEGDEAGDRSDLAHLVVVGPGDILLDGVASARGPVPRCDAFIWADGLGVAGLELIRRDVGGVDVVTRRQPGFEKQYGTAGLAKYDAVEFDPDVAMGAQRVDSHVRVARVGDDLFVFFVPVKCVSFEPHVARDRAVAVGVVDACRGFLGAPVGRQRMDP